MSQVLGLCVGIGSLQDVDRSAQCRPRALCVGRLETVARFFTWRQADEDAVEVRVLQVEIQSQGMDGPCPEPEERRFLQTHEMVHVSGQIIKEVVEVPVAIAVTDADAGFFRKIPGEFGLVSCPSLVEGRLGYGRRPSWRCWRSKCGTQQGARWHCTAIVEFVEIAILRYAVGPEIEFLDQAQMLGQVQCGLEIDYVRNAVGCGCPSASEGEGVGAREQAAERLVQRCAGGRGTIGKGTEYF